MSLLLYELALDQNRQDKLYKEVSACYPSDHVEYGDLGKSTYLENCINETMRKHTTVIRVLRKAVDDYDFGSFKVNNVY